MLIEHFHGVFGHLFIVMLEVVIVIHDDEEFNGLGIHRLGTDIGKFLLLIDKGEVQLLAPESREKTQHHQYQQDRHCIDEVTPGQEGSCLSGG